MENKYQISNVCICPFIIGKDRLIPDFERFPQKRLCVVDMEDGFAIDIEHELRYDYIKIMNGKYLAKDQLGKIADGKRVAFLAQVTFSDELDNLRKQRKVLKKLSEGYNFPDGNEVLSNEQYIELLNEEKGKKLTKKKR